MSLKSQNTPPRGLPWIGLGFEYQKNAFHFFKRMTDEYGGFCRFKMAGLSIALISEPKLVEQVLIKHAKQFHKGPILKSLTEVLGEGLLTAEGEVWKKHRLVAQPAFHRNKIEEYAREMKSSALKEFSQWSQFSEVRAIGDDMVSITLEIVIKALFGKDLTSQKREIGKAFQTIIDFFEFSITPAGRMLNLFPNPRKKNYLSAVKSLDATIASILNDDGIREENLLTLLVKAQLDETGTFSAKHLRDEVMTLFIAGHETTARALGFCFHLLTQNQSVLDEVKTQLRNHTSDLLKKVIQESLRMYPPVWTIGREAIESIDLESVKIDKGEVVLIPVHAIHQSPLYFPDPEQFNPERWTPEFEKSLPRPAYLPFGLGPRMCIGQGFAMMELEIILTEVIKNFDLEATSTEALELVGTLTARPKNPILIKVTKISQSAI